MLFHQKMIIMECPDIAAQVLAVSTNEKQYARLIRSPTMAGGTGKIEQNLIDAWNAEKRSVLRKALALKFKNERLATKLKETAGRTLVENDNAADNAMHADLLMELRAKLLGA